MGVLIISGILGLLPLLGIGYIVMNSNGITVGALFTSLILLTMSGIFFLNIALELLQRRKAKLAASQPGQPVRAAAAAAGGSGRIVSASAGGTFNESGVVESVSFYESPVGQPDKSLVTLRSNNGSGGKTLVFTGDLRNALPAGKRVKITYAAESEGNRLVAVGE